MSKGNTYENDLLKLIFNAVAIADLAENDGSTPATDLEVSLHTADPGEGGTQSTSEANYTGYARMPVSRDTDGWTVLNNGASNAAPITFGACTLGSSVVTYFAVGLAHAGAGKLLYSGLLTNPLSVVVGIIPTFPIGALNVTED